jgi:hypothetical protein
MPQNTHTQHNNEITKKEAGNRWKNKKGISDTKHTYKHVVT